jgi:quinol monooxygenase YgiN
MKLTTKPGLRPALNEVIYTGLSEMSEKEPGCLTALLIEDANDDNVTYIFERFANQSALDAHNNSNSSKEFVKQATSFLVAKEKGIFKAVIGFLSKED